jgi:hypothetical protein
MSTSIYAYRKASNAHTEIVMALPDNQGQDDETRATELCTIAGITYVAVPDTMALPEQPPELDIKPVTLTPELKTAIRAESTHCQFIDERRQAMIRSRYTAEDETGMTRMGLKQSLGVAQMTEDQKRRLFEYDGWVERCLAWAKGERAKLGL